jgi:uroporphyrinogen-III synthase
MTRPLEGCTIALAESRQLEELAQMLEIEGAAILRCPLVGILDAPDPTPVTAWLRELITDRFGYVILYTGEGVRRLLALAEREGIKAAVLSALERTRTVTRGPKPVRAMKEVGLTPTRVAQAPTTEGLIATLAKEPVRGQTVGVQLYAEGTTPLIPFLEGAGASVHTVLPYVYAPAADADRVAALIGEMVTGSVQILVFTSSPQVDRLYEVAKERALESDLQVGLQRTRIAAVGPVLADHLRAMGACVDICPEQGFVMKNLVQYIKRAYKS